jgi:hypothetical protein
MTCESESELYYDRRSVGQSVLVSSPHLGLMTRVLLLSNHCGFLIWGVLSGRGRVCLLQCTMYNIQHILLSQIWDSPQPGVPGPCIYIPQEQGGPVIPSGTGLGQLTCESITCPFIPRCEPNVEHCLQQFTLFRVYPFLCKRVLIPHQPIRCLANRMLAVS